MALGNRKAGGSAWTSVILDTERVTIAEVERSTGGKPRVRACEGFARAGDDPGLLKRLSKRLARRRCTTLLGEGQYQLLQIDMPDNAAGMSRDELRASLRWRVKDRVDVAVERAGIDLLDIPAVGNRPAQLWVVVASHDVLQPLIRNFQAAGIGLAAIDIPELAQRNLAVLFEEPKRGLAFLGLDRRGGWLTVTYQGELYMARRLDVGTAELTGTDVGMLHERVLLDIQRSLDNFDRIYGAISLSRLLVGPLPGGEAFVAYLCANLALPVAGADFAEVLDIAATPHLARPAEQAAAWLALGAALRE